MPLPLYQEVDKLVDKAEIEQILLTLEEDLIKYMTASKDLKFYKDQLTFIDKINPFGERDKKGEILKIEYEMADIAKIYNADMKVIKQKSAQAIKSVDAFMAKFQLEQTIRSIEKIKARKVANHHSGRQLGQHVRIEGRQEAINLVANLDNTLNSILGPMYSQCPPYPTFLEGYMRYLLDPFQLPMKLKEP